MMGAVLLAAAASASIYACEIERQAVVNHTPDGGWGGDFQPVAERDRAAFRFELARSGERAVAVTTKTDIMNIAGKAEALPLAPGQIAFAVPNVRCTFTEQQCLAMVELSEMGVGKASVTVTVAGSSKVEGRDIRNHFQLMFLGSCVIKPSEKLQ